MITYTLQALIATSKQSKKMIGVVEEYAEANKLRRCTGEPLTQLRAENKKMIEIKNTLEVMIDCKVLGLISDSV